GKVHLLGEKERIVRHTLGMARGVGVAQFDHLRESNDSLDEQGLLSLLQLLSAFKSVGHVGREGVGAAEIVARERLIHGPAFEVQDAKIPVRRAKQRTNNRT